VTIYEAKPIFSLDVKSLSLEIILISLLEFNR